MKHSQRGMAVGIVVLIVAALSLAAGGTYVATSEEVDLVGEASIFNQREDAADTEATTSADSDLDLNLDGKTDIDLDGDTSKRETGTYGDVESSVDVETDLDTDVNAEAKTSFWTKLGL